MRYLKVCTKEKPYTGIQEEGVYWQHPDAIELYEDEDGDYIRYECPTCGHRFWVELPN